MLSNKSALITRGYEDSILLAEKLRILKIEPMIDPLLKIKYLKLK